MKIDPKALMMEINKLNSASVGNADSKRTERREDAAPAPANAAARSADAAKIEVSSEARAVQGILHNLAKSPDVDSAKVTRVKAALDEGRYSVDNARVADKMIAREQELKDKKQ